MKEKVYKRHRSTCECCSKKRLVQRRIHPSYSEGIVIEGTGLVKVCDRCFQAMLDDL